MITNTTVTIRWAWPVSLLIGCICKKFADYYANREARTWTEPNASGYKALATLPPRWLGQGIPKPQANGFISPGQESRLAPPIPLRITLGVPRLMPRGSEGSLNLRLRNLRSEHVPRAEIEAVSGLHSGAPYAYTSKFVPATQVTAVATLFE